nr:hypothetical protein [Sphaerotilus sp. FB-5]
MLQAMALSGFECSHGSGPIPQVQPDLHQRSADSFPSRFHLVQWLQPRQGIVKPSLCGQVPGECERALATLTCPLSAAVVQQGGQFCARRVYTEEQLGLRPACGGPIQPGLQREQVDGRTGMQVETTAVPHEFHTPSPQAEHPLPQAVACCCRAVLRPQQLRQLA